MGLLHALPFRSQAPRPKTLSRKPSYFRPPRSFYIGGGIFVYILTTYSFYLYKSLDISSQAPQLPQDADVSFRYNDTAEKYDKDIDYIEWVTGIQKARKKLTQQAKGHVLEASVGTGRNASYYDLKHCKSVTFVDQSGPMVDIARRKWDELHPRYKNCAFRIQSTTDPVVTPKGGFTTLLQTMGICSTPNPAATLAYLGSLADPDEGRILLLEHGKGYYDWLNQILDKSATKHAEKHGCWYNRDVGKILEESGLVLEKVTRKQFGTLWYVEARPAAWKKPLETTN